MSYEILFDRMNTYSRKHRLPWWSCDVSTLEPVFEVPLKFTVPPELTYWRIDHKGRRLYRIDDQKRAGKLLRASLFRDVVAVTEGPKHLSRVNRGALV